MKILHFSDLHCGCKPHGFRWLFDKRILGLSTHFLRRSRHQNWTTLDALADLARDIRPDLILCTGDLTAVSAPDEFKAAARRLAPLRNLPGIPFLCIPGNHDAYIRTPEAQHACRTTLRRLNRHTRHDSRTLPQKLLLPDQTALFLLDAATPQPFWRSGGTASLTQHARLLKELLQTPGHTRILVSHFPLCNRHDAGPVGFRRGLTGEHAFRSLAQDGLLDFVLCGHIHTPFITKLGPCTQICPGSITLHHHAALLDTVTQSAHLIPLIPSHTHRHTS